MLTLVGSLAPIEFTSLGSLKVIVRYFKLFEHALSAATATPPVGIGGVRVSRIQS